MKLLLQSNSTADKHAAALLQVEPLRVRYACVLLTGVLWWLAAQQPGWFALGWIALVPMLWASAGLPPRARWKYGYLTGVASYALINWWIVVAVTKGAPMIGVPPAIGTFLGAAGVLLIGLIQGTQVGLIALAWQQPGRLARRAPWLLPLLIALLWYVLETIRASTPLAHSWGAFAFTQWRDTALLQSVSWLGQHGLSALCVWFAASIALWLRHTDAQAHLRGAPQLPGAAHLWRAPVLTFLGLHIWGAWQIRNYDRSTPQRQSLPVLLVQTNIGSGSSAPQLQNAALIEATRLTRQHFDTTDSGLRPQLVVWPETTTTVAARTIGSEVGQVTDNGVDAYGPYYLQHLRIIKAMSRELQTAILFGAQAIDITFMTYGADENKQPHTNDAVLVTPDGKAARSSKERLVPFGERAPFSERLPFLKYLAPYPEISTYGRPQSMDVVLKDQTVRIGSLICFESCFPDPARQRRRDGAQLLTILTNDEWFTGTNAPWEHAAMAAVRAVENRLPVVQAANGGYSFVVDPCGRFVVKSSFGKAQAIAVAVPYSPALPQSNGPLKEPPTKGY